MRPRCKLVYAWGKVLLRFATTSAGLYPINISRRSQLFTGPVVKVVFAPIWRVRASRKMRAIWCKCPAYAPDREFTHTSAPK